MTAQGTARRLQKTTLSAPVQAAAEEIRLAGGGTPFIVDQLARALTEAEEGNGHGPPEDRLRGLACSGIADWALVLASDVDPVAPALLRAIAVLGGDSELRRVAALAGVDPGPAGAIADLLMDVGLLVQDDRLSSQPAVASAIGGPGRPASGASENSRAANILNEEGEPAERVADVLLRASRMGSAATVEALSMAAAVAPLAAPTPSARSATSHVPSTSRRRRTCARIWCSSSGAPRRWPVTRMPPTIWRPGCPVHARAAGPRRSAGGGAYAVRARAHGGGTGHVREGLEPAAGRPCRRGRQLAVPLGRRSG